MVLKLATKPLYICSKHLANFFKKYFQMSILSGGKIPDKKKKENGETQTFFTNPMSRKNQGKCCLKNILSFNPFMLKIAAHPYFIFEWSIFFKIMFMFFIIWRRVCE